MTGVLLVALYLLALSLFLGLDMIPKVPQTLFAVVIAALGALAAVGFVGGLLVAPAEGGSASAWTMKAAVSLGAFAASASLVAMGRLLGAYRKRRVGARRGAAIVATAALPKVSSS